MLVKVLDENRVKILMEDQDIAYYDVPFEKLDYDDPISKAFIYELIHKTYESTGVDFKNCRVMIEVIPGVSRAYYILLTRMDQEGLECIQFDKVESIEREVYIFKLKSAYEVLRFFNQLSCFPPDGSSLYFYGDYYYAVISYSLGIIKEQGFLKLMLSLEEYGERCRFQLLNEGLLAEWGRCLLDHNAYDLLISS